MLFRFNRLTLLANIVSLQFTEISEYQPSPSYRASKSRFFPYIHCKFCRVCPTIKMASATVKPSIVCRSQGNSSTTEAKHYLESLRISKQIWNTLTGFTLQFCRNYSLRVDTGVRVRIFSKYRNIEIL